MDKWLELFHAELVPAMKECGIRVESTWVNPERTQFIWIRSYGDEMADLERKEAAFYGSPFWQANVDRIRSHIAHRDMTVIESVAG